MRLILDTLHIDLVDARNRHAHRCTQRMGRQLLHLVEHIIQGVRVDLCRVHENHRALPPGHVVGLLQQTLTRPTGNGKHGRVLLDEILLAPDFDHHALHQVRDLVVLFLLVASGVAIHLCARSRHVMEGSGRTQKTCGYVSCQVNDEDKACCRLQRRLRASMAACRRLY